MPGVAEEPEGGDPMQVEVEVVDEYAMMDDYIVEVVMDEDNVEYVDVEDMEVQTDDEVLPADVEIVDVLPGELEFMDIDFNPEVAVELPRVNAPRVDRPAGVQHPLPDRHYIGPLNQVCRHCEARHFNCERTSRGHFTLCCNNNQMVIAEGPRRLQEAPELLQSLLVDDSQIATQYRRDIRRYNNTLAFAAFSTDLNQRRLPGRGPRVFTVHGQVYRRITNDVVRNDDRHPSYCELYFIESGEANRARMNQNHQGELNETVLTDLDTMLRQTNPFAMAFSNMRAVWLEEQRIANANPLVQPRRVTMHLVADPNSDPRRYNLPPAQVNEVSVVFAGNNGQPPGNLDLVVYDSNPVNPQHRMQTLSYGSQHADPMLYPLLFPHGELGWHFELRQDDGGRRNAVRTRNTIREFVCHRLAIRYEGTNDQRHRQLSLIHRGGFLLQQYVCDQYVRMETNNLRFIERNQRALFAEAYQGLVDHINQQLHIDEPAPVGRRMILPSTFTGGPRYMKQSYQDAMTIVRKYGKPDLFITFTCNPGWPEIVNNKGNHAVASDRPELVARVFHAKLKQLMSDITENRVFGNVDAYVYTVEFQKRGLPHAHILIILSDGNKLLTAEDVDDVVCAELPDPADENNQRLFTAVTSHMIHGPCGQLNRNSPCMAEGICLKKYPKAYSAETVYVSDGGYPTYRRPDNGIEALVRGHQVSNEFVVAYNPYLLAKYDAHINVEVCSTVKSVKYLYKYVFKGHDMATVEVQDRNEIEK